MLILTALVRGAAIADELAASRLHFWAGGQSCAGDCDEGIAFFNPAARPGVKAERVPLVEPRIHGRGIKARAAQQIIRRVHDRERAYQFAWQPFALESCPGPCRIDPPQMPTPMQLVREVEVMEDSVDRLHDLHGYATHPHRRATRSAHSSSVGSDGNGTV